MRMSRVSETEKNNYDFAYELQYFVPRVTFLMCYKLQLAGVTQAWFTIIVSFHIFCFLRRQRAIKLQPRPSLSAADPMTLKILRYVIRYIPKYAHIFHVTRYMRITAMRNNLFSVYSA